MASASTSRADAGPHSSHFSPHIHLLLHHAADAAVFQRALAEYPLPAAYPPITSTAGRTLRQLDPTWRFDCVVSPANSYGRMDGGFDDALSQALSPPGDYLGLTRAVQAALYAAHHGFAPPGTCTLVPFTFARYGAQRPAAVRPWGVRVVAVCPTMRVPHAVQWDREVVYECVWSLLCAVARWNGSCAQEKDMIKDVLMTPLATGVGRVSPERWAAQMLLALRHFDEACAERSAWQTMQVPKILEVSAEVEKTHEM